MSPETRNARFFRPMVSVEDFAPAPMVNDLHTTLVVTAGWFAPVNDASPITTSTDDVGTPLDQFDAVFQTVLVLPVHDVDCPKAFPSNKRVRIDILMTNRITTNR